MRAEMANEHAEWLKRLANTVGEHFGPIGAGHCRAAASEIERLEAERDDLQRRLDEATKPRTNHCPGCEDRQRRLDEAQHAIIEVRSRLHAAGRRPEECYEMSVLDAALDLGDELKETSDER